MKLNILLLFIVLLGTSVGVFSQGVGIGSSSFTPDASAILEMQATQKGMLTPRMTWANRPPTPVEGLLIYSTTDDGSGNGIGFYYYNGTVWVKVGTGIISGSGAANHLAYWSSANNLTYDNNQLYWDATNNRLGIAAATPSQTLEIGGTNSQIYMNSATSNMLYFNTSGVAAPAFTTRSAGTKLVLYPAVTGASVDYAIGIDGFTMWHTVPVATSSYFYKFYAGTTQLMQIRGDGKVSINQTNPDTYKARFEVNSTYSSGSEEKAGFFNFNYGSDYRDLMIGTESKGIFSRFNGTSYTGDTYGVQSAMWNDYNNAGVKKYAGYFSTASDYGNKYGVYAETKADLAKSNTAFGVYGMLYNINAGTNPDIFGALGYYESGIRAGVYGKFNCTYTNDVVSYGGYFSNINAAAYASAKYGIFASASGACTTTNTPSKYGIYTEATGTATTNYGLYSTASGATNNYALIVPSGGGNVGIGTTVPYSTVSLEVVGNSGFSYYGTGSYPSANFARSRHTTIGSHTIVQTNDHFGELGFYGSDGTTWRQGAAIVAECDASPGASDMPGRLSFLTTPDGTDVPSVRMQINNTGKIGMNNAPRTDAILTAKFSDNYVSPYTYAGYFENTNASATDNNTKTGVSSIVSGNIGTGTGRNKSGFATDVTGTADINMGVWATASGATTNYGIVGNLTGSTGTTNYALVGIATGATYNYSLFLNGDFFNQQTSAGLCTPSSRTATTLKTSASIIYRTGSSIIIQAYYSATLSTGVDVYLKLTRQDGAGAETDIAYSASSPYGGTTAASVNIVWRETGLTDNASIVYRLYVSSGATLSNENYALVPMLIKE